MTPTKLLIGQILVVFAITLFGVWSATQWAAAMLGYQPQLGPPWLVLFGTPVYRPWQLFPWWYAYEAYAPHIFDKAGMLAGASGFMGCTAAIAGSLWRARQSRLVTTYGSSRWATPREVERAGLFRSAGVFLGRLGNRYLRHDGPEHVMAFAPTRSGKGVGLVVPTLLSWTGSAVIHDIKGENWQLTAGWRGRFSHCLLFNPTDPRFASYYNPLQEVRSRQETARPLLTPGEVMQLPPADELVLVSGLAPIRARKLRYYQDRNFSARVLPAPELAEHGYLDRPAARPDDWSGLVRGPHVRLATAEESALGFEDEVGVQQQRHPGLPEEGFVVAARSDPEPDPIDDESDLLTDQRVMDRLRGLGTVIRAHVINEGRDGAGPGDDLLPSF